MIQNSYCIISFVFLFVTVAYSDVSMCPKGFFRLNEMTHCQPLLTCKDVRTIEKIELIGYGTVKNVYLAKWKNHLVAYSCLRDERYRNDFRAGLSLLRRLSPNAYTVQLIGYCESDNIIITEYHKFNNGNNIKYFLQARPLIGFKLCLNYVQILDFIHNSPVGVRVNCDTNSVEKLLSQLLIKDDLTLILNDLDALPEVTANSTVKCGAPETLPKTSFIPPEQSLVYLRYHKNNHGYSVQSDIWKVPDVCNYFLQGPDFSVFQYSIFGIHKKCKSWDTFERPTSKTLMKWYQNVLDQFSYTIL